MSATAQQINAELELGVTSRHTNGVETLVVHRVSCKLKAPKTPLALVSTKRLWGTAATSCSTCQPSQAQSSAFYTYVSARRDADAAASRQPAQLEPCVDELDEPDAGAYQRPDEIIGHAISDEHLRGVLERVWADDAISTFLATAASPRVREIAQGADVVPLTKRGKRNVRRNARHDQRDVAPRAAAAPVPEGDTKRCIDCQKDVKLTSFPTSTKGGQVVRLDYCRRCRSLRVAAKAAK